MKVSSLSLFIWLGVIALAPCNSNGQSIWDLGTVPYLGGCTKVGLPLLPGVDPWIFNAHCMTYQGTVGCVNGTCQCNQPLMAHFNVTLQACVGHPNAFCTAEKGSIFPTKNCTQNAECVSIQGEGHSIGKCECMYGYVLNPLLNICIKDDTVEDGDRSTPRTTTTTVAPPREPFKLPPLGLLLNSSVTTYNQQCHSKSILNRTYCDTYTRTVACLDQKCQCNMREDSVFDEELNMCVGLAGTPCLGRRSILGFKACIKNADCVLEGGRSLEDGYSFGTCDCIWGYKEQDDGSCALDPSIPNPSTQRTVVPSSTPTPDPNITTTRMTPTTPNGSHSSMYSGGYILISSIVYVVYHNFM